jgi:hypothetical protein
VRTLAQQVARAAALGARDASGSHQRSLSSGSEY